MADATPPEPTGGPPTLPPTPIELGPRRSDCALLAAGGLLMTAASIAVALLAGPIGVLVGAIGAAFFGAATLIWLGRLLARGPVLTLTREGFHDRRLTRGPVPWTATRRLSVWSRSGERFIVLKLSDEDWRALPVRPLTRLARRANRALGADGLPVTARGLQTTHNELHASVKALRRAAKDAARAPAHD